MSVTLASTSVRRTRNPATPRRRSRPPVELPVELRASTTGILILLAIAALSFAQSIMVPTVAAMLTGLLFGPLQNRLERRGLPSGLAALLIVTALIVAGLATVRVMVIPFEQFVERLPEIWIAVKRQLFALREVILAIKTASDAVEASTGIDASGQAAVTGPAFLSGLAIGVPAAIAQIVLFVGVLYFFLATRTRLRSTLLTLCLARHNRLKVGRTIQQAEAAVSIYLTTVTAINIGLGVVTGLALTLVGLPNGWFWGALAGILNFIPYLGPGIMTILLIGAGLLQDGAGVTPFVPAMLFFGINLIEATFVTPSVLGRSLTVEPLLVVLSLAFWLWLWGAVGAWMAVPLLLVIKAVIHAVTTPDPLPAIRLPDGGKP